MKRMQDGSKVIVRQVKSCESEDQTSEVGSIKRVRRVVPDEYENGEVIGSDGTPDIVRKPKEYETV